MGTPSFGPHIGTCGGSHPPNASLVLTTAAALQTTGLARLGYTLLEIDDGWPSSHRDNKTGEIVADLELFPDGMARLVKDLATMGPIPFRLGLYTDRGTSHMTSHGWACFFLVSGFFIGNEGGLPGPPSHLARTSMCRVRVLGDAAPSTYVVLIGANFGP